MVPLQVATEFPGSVQFDLGLNLTIDHGLSAFRAADTIIVAGSTPASPNVIHALRDAHRRGVRIVSLCAGAFLLAEAGLLDGRKATTHWHITELLHSRYADTDVVNDVLYVDNGDVLTSAGLAAAIDLAIHIVRLDHGADVADRVARNMVVAPHRHGGQARFVAAPAATVASIEEVAQCSGFRSAAAMRPHFTRQVTTSPADYRRGFAVR